MNLVVSPSQQRGLGCLMGDSEQDHMYPIGVLVADEMALDPHFKVYLIPKLEGQDNDNLIEAVRLSNEFIMSNDGTGYHLALHSDGGHYATGASGLYLSAEGQRFITPIFNKVSDLTPWPDVGLRRRTDLYELNNTVAYAGLLEVSFHDIAREAAWIHQSQKLIASTIVDGIYAFFGLPRPQRIDIQEQYRGLRAGLQDLLEKYKEV
jgi:N-acetylmuramoyl-L-alanine amidase